MIMKSYYNFNNNFEISKKFTFVQEQLILKNFQIFKDNAVFKTVKVNYNCIFDKNSLIDNSKPGIIICIKDNIDLLKFTINKILKYKVLELCNLLIVDDRSSKNDIRNYCKNQNINYIKINSDYGFNFSILNNVGAKLFKDNGCKNVIFWNSDVWLESEETIKKILEHHTKNNYCITGSRLLYPKISWDGSTEVPVNISSVFNEINNYRETCQFGGSSFLFKDINYHPIHYGRFKNSKYTKLNAPVNFITGAFMIINVEKFFEVGGFNPSLPLQCQDVDLCLKIRELDDIIYYVGEETLYHDESVSLVEKMNSPNFVSDYYVFNKIWTYEKILKILAGEL